LLQPLCGKQDFPCSTCGCPAQILLPFGAFPPTPHPDTWQASWARTAARLRYVHNHRQHQRFLSWHPFDNNQSRPHGHLDDRCASFSVLVSEKNKFINNTARERRPALQGNREKNNEKTYEKRQKKKDKKKDKQKKRQEKRQTKYKKQRKTSESAKKKTEIPPDNACRACRVQQCCCTNMTRPPASAPNHMSRDAVTHLESRSAAIARTLSRVLKPPRSTTIANRE